MNILIAFDKFKDNMTAFEACNAAKEAIQSAENKHNIALKPLTDGGEGFCEILTHTAQGTALEIDCKGPLKESCKAPIGFVTGDNLSLEIRESLQLPKATNKLAIIEMATVAGLEQVPHEKRNPWTTTSYGVGQLLIMAKKEKADAILLGIGGSATNDMGIGMLAALACEFKDADNKVISNPTPENWQKIQSIELKKLEELPTIRIACDVSNPLLGERGATRVYGPQKGLKASDVVEMETQFEQMSEKLCESFQQELKQREIPSSGAAGGIGFGLKLAYDAKYIPGFELVKQWLDIESAVKEADIILTGEGKFDQSSLEGKGPGRVLRLGSELGKRVYVLAGHVDKEILHSQKNPHTHIQSIEPDNMPLEIALKSGKENMKRTVSNLF